jgi:hypothetical protein
MRRRRGFILQEGGREVGGGTHLKFHPAVLPRIVAENRTRLPTGYPHALPPPRRKGEEAEGRAGWGYNRYTELVGGYEEIPAQNIS